ncbi:hypothetical protein LPJ59_005280 [Coemansia sp. RSA 2399]|nr:hypothetical protein LPJ59_005280 [Coemansia sp. RSA 2399]
MLAYSASIATAFLAMTVSAFAAPLPAAIPGHAHLARRCGGCGFGGVYPYGGYGGYGYGFGFPFASSFTNGLNTNFNAANYNDDTLYVNNKDGNSVNSNLNTFNNANTVF